MTETTVPAPVPGVPATGQESTRDSAAFVPPAVDIFETDAGLTVVADVPGVTRENLNVEVRDGVLSIEGRVSSEMEIVFDSREFELAGFYREFRLPEQIDPSRIRAGLKHGVLTLELPKAAEHQPRRIAVTSE